MSDVAAFQATYADLKTVKSRGMLQIIFEAPIENDQQILAVLGGMPRAAEERWFAIARLNSDGAAAEKSSLNTPLKTDERQGRSLAQRAAISCNAPVFRVFLERMRGGEVNDYQAAHDRVCAWLEIESLKELDRDEAVAARWEELWGKYITWKTAARYVETT